MVARGLLYQVNSVYFRKIIMFVLVALVAGRLRDNLLGICKLYKACTLVAFINVRNESVFFGPLLMFLNYRLVVICRLPAVFSV